MFSLEFAYCQFISRTLVHVDSATFSGATSHGLQWENTERTSLKGLLLASVHITNVTERELNVKVN